MRVVHWATVVLALGLLSGCRFGRTVESFPPARSPYGIMSTFTTNGGRFAGELIEVRDDGIIIFAKQMFRLLPYNVIISSKFDGLSPSDVLSDRHTPKPAAREQLRLLSRFPRGLPPELLQKLLEANGQAVLAGETS